MAIRKATKQTEHRLKFTDVDLTRRKALEDHALRLRYSALIEQGDPIPKALDQRISAMKKPVGRPTDVQGSLRKIAMGVLVEDWKRSLTRHRAIEKVAAMHKIEPEEVAKAHSLYMRLAGIPQARGRPRKK